MCYAYKANAQCSIFISQRIGEIGERYLLYALGRFNGKVSFTESIGYTFRTLPAREYFFRTDGRINTHLLQQSNFSRTTGLWKT